MRKILLIVILIIPSFLGSAQTPDLEIQAIDSLHKNKILTQEQANQLSKKWTAFISRFKYPEFNQNALTGEMEISDTVSFPDADKKVIFQRCLQWIAINYGDLVYDDPESGKIIANGLIDLKHSAEFQAGFGSRDIHPVQTSTNYTMILTIKDKKMKYLITNINYNFRNYSVTEDEVSLPINSLFPIVIHDQLQWMRFVTVLNASIEQFNVKLKNSLIGYVNDVVNDYKF